MKAASLGQLEDFLGSVRQEYEVVVPVALSDGTVSMGSPDEGKLSLTGRRTAARPASVFFPHCDRVLIISSSDEMSLPAAPAKPLLVVGLRAPDLDCLEFTDNFFNCGYRDDLYFSRRQSAVVVGLSGRCTEDGGFSRICGGKCDLELVCDGEVFYCVAYSGRGRKLEEKIEGSLRQGLPVELTEESESLSVEGEELLRKTAELLAGRKVPDHYWAELAERCIECTGCNLVCPTCTCFEVYDRDYNGQTVRSRLWDSCQLSGYAREASGFNPMGAQMSRTRRRLHHKLVDDPRRWGVISCFLCGRCDEICPTGIGIMAVSREIVDRFG
ncbi:MAG: hypothetical protein FVQ81_03905 [Candidatus Glassbacteria bacterium]|nr:hypothetical protein [Candidatus Glassbacteria bacterium]